MNAANLRVDHYDPMVSSLPKWHYRMCYKLHLVALFCAITGGPLFVAGSFFYAPSLANTCAGKDHVGVGYCRSSGDFGTQLYIIGSALFVLQAVLILISSVLSHKGTIEKEQEER